MRIGLNLKKDISSENPPQNSKLKKCLDLASFQRVANDHLLSLELITFPFELKPFVSEPKDKEGKVKRK